MVDERTARLQKRMVSLMAVNARTSYELDSIFANAWSLHPEQSISSLASIGSIRRRFEHLC